LPIKDRLMAESEKRKISAREILLDMRSGMNDAELKEKHGLSDSSFESVMHKLGAAGLLTKAELQKRAKSAKVPGESAQRNAEETLALCPSCNAAMPAGAPECPTCGVVFSKVSSQQAQDTTLPLIIPIAEATSSNWWVFVVAVVVVVGLAGGVVMFWPKDRPKQVPQAVTTETRSAVAEEAEADTDAAEEASAEGEKEDSAPLKVSEQTGVVPGEAIELHFSGEGFPLGLSVSQSSALHLFETPNANQNFRTLPPETGVKRFYDEFNIAGQTFLVLTEESNPPKLYLDANRNGDLTDDPGPFIGEAAGIVPNHYTLQLPYPREKASAPYKIWLFPSRMGGVQFYPKCHWYGELLVNGRTYKVVLFDGNADGDYSNDPVIIDLDNDGKVSDAEKLKPGQSCTIDGTAVKLISVAASGRWVRFEF
jgi:hypothetical protein